jgi:menaquinone-dependent protoporphyrinogen oxidase
LAERDVRMMPRTKGNLPSGDFRDWPAIDPWAHEISTAVRYPDAV